MTKSFYLSVQVLIASLCASTLVRADNPKGVLPTGPDGKALNLGFEDGTLKDWKVDGKAFEGQPIKGDTVSPRRSDMPSNHAGNYWIGGYEKLGDIATGTLTSTSFKVDHTWASFLVAGGAWPDTCVELLEDGQEKPFFKSSGTQSETLLPVIVDLQKERGKLIYIRLVDQRTGDWGHVNFDDFLFYDDKPIFKQTLDPSKAVVPAPADVVKFAGLKPADAVKEFGLPEGFKATMFAAEPDIVQPIAFTIDARGRLWVVEGLTYPRRVDGTKGNDRIVILEDTNNDGVFDKRTVFIENLDLVSGIEVGFGGVFVGAAPYMLFIPDKDGDDKPDGEPQVLLDGFGYQDTHETLNTFTWGPDGWLYGCHGVFTYSKVGKPGTPDDQRVAITAGVWRYHPTKKIFEVFAEGTSNPWGIDFDANGQLFAEACVIPHMWHLIQGARYQRQGGEHPNPYTYDDIKQSADHVHYAGSQGPHAGNGRSDSMGGGHAHAGLMVYQGENWPEKYRGQIYLGNIHGSRINMDVPEHKGSGFVVHHGADFLMFNDRWSQVINFRAGPDGGVYFIDWYDANQCHNPDPKAHDQSNGRIYKVTYGTPKAPPAGQDLSKLSDEELVKMQLSPSEWHVRTARRILQERAGEVGQPNHSVDSTTDRSLEKIVMDDVSPAHKQRAMWALDVRHAFSEDLGLTILNAATTNDEYVTAWAIQLLAENGQVSTPVLARYVALAKENKSAVVRLYLASVAQRLPIEQRWDIVAGLVAHDEDADDHNLPLMDWYALEPLVATDPAKALKMVATSKIPNLRAFAARRIAAGIKPAVPKPDGSAKADTK